MGEWQPAATNKPPIQTFTAGRGWTEKPYVLAVDAKGRMSIGYAMENSSPPGYTWVFAKPIGMPTHWMPLPDPPITGYLCDICHERPATVKGYRMAACDPCTDAEIAKQADAKA